VGTAPLGFASQYGKKVYLSASAARNVVHNVLLSLKAEIEERYSNQPLVERILFTTSTAFKQEKLDFLARSPETEDMAGFIAQLHLPHFVWIVEVSPMEQYFGGLSIGELVLDATAGLQDNSLIYARIGQTIHYRAGARKEHFTSVPDQLPLFTHNLGRRSSEQPHHAHARQDKE
jgi:hypothetical protein